MFDGDFLAPSPWRGVPTQALDEAWHNITNAGIKDMRIKISDLKRLNKTKSEKTKFIYEDGEDGIAVGSLEVFHHLHCLVGTLEDSVFKAATAHKEGRMIYARELGLHIICPNLTIRRTSRLTEHTLVSLRKLHCLPNVKSNIDMPQHRSLH